MIPGILRKTSALLAGFALLAAPALSQNTTPAPAETRRLHVELTLEEAIRAAQEQSIAAMVAKYTFLSSYWSFRSFRASRLPSLNLSGEVLSFDRSLRLLQDYDTGEMRYLENYNLQNTIGLSIRQNIALTGGTLQLYSSLNRLDQFAPKDSKSYYSQPITLSYTQPLFAYNQFKWDKKIAPKEYELAKRTYIEAMEDVTTQAVSYYFALLLSKTRHEIAVKNYDNTKALYAIAEKRLKLGSITHDELLQLQLRMLNDSLSINDTSLEVREQQMRFNSYLRYNENVEVAPVLDDRIPAIDIDYAMVLDKALENSSFDIGNQIQMLNAESDIARARAERGASATLNARFGLSQTGEEFRTAYSNLLDQEVVGLQFSIPIFDWGLGKGESRDRPQPDRTGGDRLPPRDLHAHRAVPQPAQPVRRGRPGPRGRRTPLLHRAGELPAGNRLGDGHEHGPDREGSGQPDLRLGAGRLLELLLLAAPQDTLRLHLPDRHQRGVRQTHQRITLWTDTSFQHSSAPPCCRAAADRKAKRRTTATTASATGSNTTPSRWTRCGCGVSRAS